MHAAGLGRAAAREGWNWAHGMFERRWIVSCVTKLLHSQPAGVCGDEDKHIGMLQLVRTATRAYE